MISLSSFVKKKCTKRQFWLHGGKKEGIWPSPMTKALTPQKTPKKQSDNVKTPPKSSITQRLRTDLKRPVIVTDSHPTGVVKPVYGIPTFPLTTKAVEPKGHIQKNAQSDNFGYMERKRKGSDPVLWQKPLHHRKLQKSKVTTWKRHQNFRLHNDCGPTYNGQLEWRTATQLVLLNRFTGSQPFH